MGNPTDYNGLMNAFSASGVISASKAYPIYFAEMGITVGSASERLQYDNILHVFSDQGWSWGAWWFKDINIFAFVDSRASPTTEGLIYQKWLNAAAPAPLHPKATLLAKVYFIASRFDVKLQADNLVRWDVAVRLNRKQKTHKKVKNMAYKYIAEEWAKPEEKLRRRTHAPTPSTVA
jgi:hypothetical protein